MPPALPVHGFFVFHGTLIPWHPQGSTAKASQQQPPGLSPVSPLEPSGPVRVRPGLGRAAGAGAPLTESPAVPAAGRLPTASPGRAADSG